MAQTIFWILSILVMVVLLSINIYTLIIRIKERKEFKEANKLQLEYVTTRLKN